MRGQVPWGLIGAIIAILGLELFISGRELDLIRPERYEWRLALRAADKKSRGCDVLCLGTSMVKQGVFPAIIERRTGLKTYNFAVCAGRTESSYYFLRRALKAGAKPSAIVMDVHPTFACSGYRTNPDAWRDGLGLRDCVEMAWSLRSPEFFAMAAVGKALCSADHRHEIRADILAALRGEDRGLRNINLRHLRNLNHNKGSVVCPPNPWYRGEISDVFRKLLIENTQPINHVQARYVRKLLKLAGSQGIRVYWVVPPFIPEVQRAREQNGLDAAYTRFVNKFVGDPNLVVIDGRRAGYDPSVFLDASHLNPQGACAFSHSIADVLQRFQGRKAAGTEWVSLRNYVAHPIDVPLEDIVQSGLALQDLEHARR